MKHNLELKTSIHNRFDIEVKDIRTGEVREKYQAENIVLNQMWTRLCGRSTYFVNIHFGTGAGALDPARTSLFTHLGTKTAVHDDRLRELPTSWWRQKVVLAPEEYVGSELTEVGVAYGSTNTNLVTHAQIRDMNGNVTSIVKTAYDVITIYATIYCTFLTSNSGIGIVGMPNNNPLVNWLIGNTTFPTLYFYTGRSKLALAGKDATVMDARALAATAALSWTADAANKRMTSSVPRLAVGDSNGFIGEIGLGSSRTGGLSRLLLPATGIYAGLAIEGASVGTGDGTEDTFALPSQHIDPVTLVVKVDGTPTTAFTKSTVAVEPELFAERCGGGLEVGASNLALLPALSGDGSVCAAWMLDRSVAVFDLGASGYVFRGTAYPPISETDSARRVCLSGNGLVLAIAHRGSPGVWVADWADGAWVARPTPPSLPSVALSDMDMDYAGTTLGIVCGTAPYAKIYDWSGTEWVARSNPTLSGAGNYNWSIRISDGGAYVYLGWYYSNASQQHYFLTWNGSSWGTRTTPAMYGNYLNVVGLSRDGAVAASSYQNTGYISYWNGSSWTLRYSTSACISVSNDGLYAVVRSANNTNYDIIHWNGASWDTLFTNGTTATVGFYGLIAGDNSIMVGLYGPVAPTGSPAYMYEMVRLAPWSEQIIFDTPPANGAVITADYTVNGIHKTNQRVIDLQATIQFGGAYIMIPVWDFARQISDAGTPGGTTSFFNEEMQSLFLKDGMIQTGVGEVERGQWQDSVAGDLIPLSDIGYSALDVEHLHNTRLYASVVKNGAVMFLMHVYSMT